MYESWSEKRTCPGCKAKLIVEFENQVTGFRQMDYLICPKCKKEIDRSMSVEYISVEVKR